MADCVLLLARVLLSLKKPRNSYQQLLFQLSKVRVQTSATQHFFPQAFFLSFPAYCITESAGMCAILPPELHRGGSVGLPIPSIEIKLLDVLHTRSSAIQQGEVCIRGPSVTPGYFERPGMKLDKTGFIEDGWLRTGDIGQWNPDGTLSLIDRYAGTTRIRVGMCFSLLILAYSLKNVVKMDRDLKEVNYYLLLTNSCNDYFSPLLLDALKPPTEPASLSTISVSMRHREPSNPWRLWFPTRNSSEIISSKGVARIPIVNLLSSVEIIILGRSSGKSAT